MKFLRWITYLLIVLCFTSVLAQAATCGAMVEQALADVQNDCTATGRNQACYGYVSLQATPREGVADFNFTKAGDLVSVADIDTLSLSRLDTTNNTWGIALMKLQANLPDTLPGQNVTVLMFGDVHIQDASAVSSGVRVSASAMVNVRSTPSTSGSIIGTLAGGQTAAATGRNPDGSWLRIQLPNSAALGWVSAAVVKVSGDTSTLALVDPTQAQTSFTPMQAFYFQTGITQTNCQQAPEDGILIQTPKGMGKIDLRANDVDIQLGSTAFIQAQPRGYMTVSVVEGEGHITANGKTVDVPAGLQTTIAMDDNLHASGTPNDPQPYDATTVQNLPVSVLPLQITIALPALATAEVTVPAAVPTPTPTPGGSGAAIGGSYQISGPGGASGQVCSLAQPFTMKVNVRISFTVNFTPTDVTKGTWNYQYTIASAGETDTASGSYTISAGSGGSLQLVMNGSDVSKFHGGGATVPINFGFTLTPISSCSG